jgi:two-component system response regulator PilR (NtrC family)
VRELENLLHRALALSDGQSVELSGVELERAMPTPQRPPVAPPNAPEAAPKAPLPADLQGYLDEQERSILVRALRETGFNRTLAAKQLGLSLRQIRYRIARLKIDAPDISGEDADD